MSSNNQPIRLALQAAEARGARPAHLPEDPPVATPIEEESIRAFAGILSQNSGQQAKHVAAIRSDLGRLSGCASETKALIQGLLEVLKEDGPQPLTGDQAATLVAQVVTLVSGSLDRFEARVKRVEEDLSTLIEINKAVLHALYQPVVPEYDAGGRVVAARRQTS